MFDLADFVSFPPPAAAALFLSPPKKDPKKDDGSVSSKGSKGSKGRKASVMAKPVDIKEEKEKEKEKDAVIEEDDKSGKMNRVHKFMQHFEKLGYCEYQGEEEHFHTLQGVWKMDDKAYFRSRFQ